MIQPVPYRRQAFEFEGCELFACSILAGLACYKGDAAQTQQSLQTGAQTGGTAISGGAKNTALSSQSGSNYSVNVNNSTGNAGGGGGSNGGMNRYMDSYSGYGGGGSNYAQSPGNYSPTTNVTLTDQGALAAAQNEIKTALDSVSAAQQTFASDTSQVEQGVVSASNSTFGLLKEGAAYVALAGCGFLAYKLFKT